MAEAKKKAPAKAANKKAPAKAAKAEPTVTPKSQKEK